MIADKQVASENYLAGCGMADIRSMWVDKVVVTLADSVASLYSRISQLLLGKDGQDYDVERGQALTRVIIVPMVAIYAIWLLGSSTQYPAWVFRSFVIYSSIAVPLSVLLLRHVIRRPGYNLARRAFAMANDYTMMAFALVAGGAEMLPITAFVLWVTAGNGYAMDSRIWRRRRAARW